MRIVETKDNKVVLETEETATLLNLLVERLWDEKGIKKAAYGAKHPSEKNMQLQVEGSNIGKAIEKACNSIIRDCNKLLKEI